jgi:hypothetical protein
MWGLVKFVDTLQFWLKQTMTGILHVLVFLQEAVTRLGVPCLPWLPWLPGEFPDTNTTFTSLAPFVEVKFCRTRHSCYALLTFPNLFGMWCSWL